MTSANFIQNFYFIFLATENLKLQISVDLLIVLCLGLGRVCMKKFRVTLNGKSVYAVYVPFRYFSPTKYLVISLPDTPQVPMPTRPFTFSGDAKILLILTCPDFFAPFVMKFIHLFLSTSRSSSISLVRCCFRCFFFFRYSLLFGRCRLQEKNTNKY